MVRWTELLGERVSQEQTVTPWVNDKFKLHEFAREHGIRMPRLLQSWSHPSHLNLEGLPDEFVLKPNALFSMWGVQLLSRRPDGEFNEKLRGTIQSVDEIIRVQNQAFARHNPHYEYRLLAEELIASEWPDRPIPLDYKLYCFYDEVRFIQQIDRNVSPIGHAFFDGNFGELEMGGRIEGNWNEVRLVEHEVPAAAKELISLGIRTMKALQSPFMRVDTFVTPTGAVLGELTPVPGDLYYGKLYHVTKQFDVELGVAWRSAEQRISDHNATE